MVVTVNFGCDIDSSWTANLQGDLKIVTELDNAQQAIYNRLMTNMGELTPLGIPEYGNESFNVLGETDIESAKQEISIYTQNCLMAEPRVDEIINITVDYQDKHATIHADVRLIGEERGTNLIINIGEEL